VGIPLLVLGVCIAIIVGPDEESSERSRAGAPATETSQEEAEPPAVAGIGDTQSAVDADAEFDLTVESAEGDPLEVRVSMESTGGEPSTVNDLQFQSYVIGTDGEAYDPDPFEAAPGCNASSADVPLGESLTTCLTFPLPPGVRPDRYQFDPFIGGESVQWELR
jgi:hypothetical protein